MVVSQFEIMTYLIAIIAGIIGATLGWFVAAALALMIGQMLEVSHFEGAFGMTAVLGIGPIGG